MRKQHAALLFDSQIREAPKEEELDGMTLALERVSYNAGHQSEPTTPPEYRVNFSSLMVKSYLNSIDHEIE